MQSIDYLLIGHLTADLQIDQSRRLGGTVAYAAYTAHAFGLRVGVLTSAAETDPLVDQLREVAQVHLIPAAQTTTFENVYSDGGRVQYIRAQAALLSRDALPSAWDNVPLIHFAPVANEIDGLGRWGNAWRGLTAQGLLRRWGADGRVRLRAQPNAGRYRRLEALVLSEHDVDEDSDLTTRLIDQQPLLVLTQGKQGGVAYRGGVPHAYTTPTVTEIDPTGAGDVFATGLFIALGLHKRPLPEALAIAAKLGALCVTREGLKGTPSAEEIKLVI
jgi:1D-myo-inositol 3-kinase